jgi:hypothetical protein
MSAKGLGNFDFVSGDIGIVTAKKYIKGEIKLTHGQLNELYTGLLNTHNYISATMPNHILVSGAEIGKDVKLVDYIKDVIHQLEAKDAKVIGQLKRIGNDGLELYTGF